MRLSVLPSAISCSKQLPPIAAAKRPDENSRWSARAIKDIARPHRAFEWCAESRKPKRWINTTARQSRLQSQSDIIEWFAAVIVFGWRPRSNVERRFSEIPHTCCDV